MLKSKSQPLFHSGIAGNETADLLSGVGSKPDQYSKLVSY